MEEIFDFRDFVIKILRGWRVILICAILLGLLGSGYRLYNGKNILRGESSPEVSDVEQHSRYELLSAKERIYNQTLESYSLYQAQLLALDWPECYAVEYSILFFDTQEHNRLNVIYGNYLNDPELILEVEQILGVEFSPLTYRSLIYEKDPDSSVLSITIIAPSIDACQQMQDAFERHMERVYQKINPVENHQVFVISHNEVPVVSDALYLTLFDLTEQTNAATKNLQAIQNEKRQINVSGNSATKRTVLVGAVFTGLLGCGAGIIIGILCIFLHNAMSTALHQADELEQLYQIRFLGSISNKEGGNHV